MNRTGTVVAAFGRQYEIELDDGGLALCYPRGKKSHLACGDRVSVELSAPDHGVIAAVAPRRTQAMVRAGERHALALGEFLAGHAT